MKKISLGKALISIVVMLYAVVSLYPLVWMLVQSLKNDLEFYQNQFAISLAPKWINYSSAWAKANFSLYYKNSLLVTGISLFLVVFSCALASYAFARIKFIGKKVFMFLFI